MKYLFVLSRDPATSGGGVRHYIRYLSQALKTMGNKVRIVSPREVESSGFDYIPIGDSSISNTRFLIRLLLKVPFMKLDNDEIICANRADFVFPFILFKRKHKKGILVHGRQYSGVGKHGRFYYSIYSKIERFSLRKSDFVLFVGNNTKIDYQNHYPDILNKINSAVIPGGMPSGDFKPLDKAKCRTALAIPSERKVIISVGRFDMEKRFDLAISALSEIKGIENLLYLIVGDGPEKAKLELMTRTLGLKDHVQFCGLVEHSKVPLYMNCADIFLLTSDRENGPIVTKEALACGLPVITTKVGDIEEFYNPELGFIVEIGQKEMLTETIELALKKHWNNEYIYKFSKQFSWDAVSLELIGKITLLQGG